MYDLNGLDDLEFLLSVHGKLRGPGDSGDRCDIDRNDVERLQKLALAGLAWRGMALEGEGDHPVG